METIIALVVGGMLLIVVINLTSMYYGGAAILQGSLIDARYRVDEMGISIQRSTNNSGRTFVFAGRLMNADGTRYVGTALTLNQPIHAIANATAFLTASGLTLAASGGADESTLVSIDNPTRPVWLLRESHQQPDGSTVFSLTLSAPGVSRRASFVASGVNSVAQLTAAKGSASTASDGHAVLILPNPLALAGAKFVAARSGMRIDFPNRVSRMLP